MSELFDCEISCTDDGGIILRPRDPQAELRIIDNLFDSVRVVVGKGGAKEVILYPDPAKHGPGIAFVGNFHKPL